MRTAREVVARAEEQAEGCEEAGQPLASPAVSVSWCQAMGEKLLDGAHGAR